MAYHQPAPVLSSLQPRPTALRSNSLASTASNASGVSLRRRSRTRTRALTTSHRGKSATQDAKSSEDDVNFFSSVEDPSPPLPDDSAVKQACGASPKSLLYSTPPARSPQCPKPTDSNGRNITSDTLQDTQVRGRLRAWTSTNLHDTLVEGSRGRQTRSEGGSIRGVQQRLRGASLPRQAYRMSILSAGSELPFDLEAIRATSSLRQNRDSVITQQSAASSSLYPASTSSSSRAESSIWPPSLDGMDEDMSSFTPEIVSHSPEDSEFNPDDVSNRLRLLMNNSYFLPPAHVKPSPLSLSPLDTISKEVPKRPAPTFLDFFRLGKSKSKPTTPVTPNSLEEMVGPPVLRTTSDSTTASGFLPHPLAHPLSQTVSTVPPPPQTRVVVLREKMEDLVSAAKQAEQDMHRDGQQPEQQVDVDDVIDPTDAVDLPVSLASYPFDGQASAANGLGVRESIGAAILAERLPPPNIPGDWSLTSEEEAWRKSLLHSAITHSLNGSAATSFSSVSAGGSVSSPAPPHVETKLEKTVADASPKRRIGERILEIRVDPGDHSVEPDVQEPVQRASDGSKLDAMHSSWHPSVNPPRAETPAVTYALTPRPHKQLFDHKSSQSGINEAARNSEMSLPLRETGSTSGLPDRNEHTIHPMRSTMSMTPPPPPSLTPPMSTHQGMSVLSLTPDLPLVSSDASYRGTESRASRSGYSEDNMSYVTPQEDTDVHMPERPSLTISLVTDGRPSLSEYSYPSPTASAFRDALFGSCRSPSPLTRRSISTEIPLESSPASDPVPQRNVAISPPPRVSSSLRPTVLPPPPRSSTVKAVSRPSLSPHHSLDHLDSSQASAPPLPESQDLIYIVEPSPSPPLPIAERRGRATSLSLRIPGDNVPLAMRSAPAPASPIDFFDHIQSQHNVMDDLDTSDESDDDDDDHARKGSVEEVVVVGAGVVEVHRQSPLESSMTHGEPLSPVSSNHDSIASSRPSFMRLGNHSTPQFSQTSLAEAKKPVGNTPQMPKKTYFKRGGKGMPLPVMTRSDGSEDTGAKPSPGGSHLGVGRRPATADAKMRHWQRESLEKFDGMLVQHMEAERDRIKRIAGNLSSGARIKA